MTSCQTESGVGVHDSATRLDLTIPKIDATLYGVSMAMSYSLPFARCSCEMSAQLFLFGTEQRMPSVMHRDVSRNVSIMGWVRSASENRFSLKLPAMPPAAPAIESCLAEPTCY